MMALQMDENKLVLSFKIPPYVDPSINYYFKNEWTIVLGLVAELGVTELSIDVTGDCFSDCSVYPEGAFGYSI
jgi:hypothetical protein